MTTGREAGRSVLSGLTLAGVIFLVVWYANQGDPTLRADRLVAGLPMVLLVVIIFAVTRKRKSGKPPKKTPPGQADADIDNWTGWG